jgi:hypothetical protein
MFGLGLRWARFRHRVNAQFLANMGKFDRIGKAAIEHHDAEFGKAGVGE